MTKLLHSKQCPNCRRGFKPEGELIPNTYDKDFYGGRIHFFKEEKCCGKNFILLIETKETEEGKQYTIVDTVDVTKQNPFETFKKRIAPRRIQEREVIPLEEHVLTTVLSRESQIKRLELCTMHELEVLCKLHKVKRGRGDSKLKIIERLLTAEPNLVVANPNG